MDVFDKTIDKIIDDIKARWHVYLLIIGMAGGGTGLFTAALIPHRECPEPTIHMWSEPGTDGHVVKFSLDTPLTDPDASFTLFQVDCGCEDTDDWIYYFPDETEEP